MIILLLLLFFTFSFPLEKAVVSIFPFYDIVRILSDGRFKTEVLIPPKVDYHFYELSTRDVLKLKKARIVFVSGIPVGGWEKKVEKFSREKVIKLSEEKDLLTYENGKLRYDPHLWLSPRRMKKVAQKVFQGFLKVDREGKKIYERNFRIVLKKIENLDEEYRRVLARCKYRTVPITHPALSYLAKDYGLRQMAISSGDFHGGVSPRELLTFMKELERRKINFIFTILGERSKLSEVLEKEYGIKVYKLNVKMMPDREHRDYFSVMRENLRVLSSALKCMR